MHQAFAGKNRHSKSKHKLDSKALQIIKNCNNCGSDHPAKRDKCPAFGQQCNGCKKWNHFKKCCRSTQANQAKHCYIKTVVISKLSTMLNGGSELHTLATFTLPCCLSSQTYDLLFYVIKSSAQPLLGLTDCLCMGLLTFNKEVHQLNTSS